MPGTTPTQGYPYPLDADAVDVAIDIQKLAEAIDPDITALLTAIANLNAGAKVYASDADLQANAPRVLGQRVAQSNGTTWFYDGTKWVQSYAPPTPWTTMTVSSPVTHLATPLQVRTNNGYVDMRGGVRIPTLGSNGFIGTLPAGHFPEVDSYVGAAVWPTASDGSNDLWATQAHIQTNGGVILAGRASNLSPWYGNVDAWFSGIQYSQAQRTLA